MKPITILCLGAMLFPVEGLAQEDPTGRLAEVLPAEVSARVLERVDRARVEGMPADAMAILALEGVAKGRSGAEVLGAVEALAMDMSTAREAIVGADRVPEQGEVEAATVSMRMGVEGSAVRELAQEQPPGRSLAIPFLVLGTLVDRGLPADEAIAAVRARLAAGANDGELGDADVGRSFGVSLMPADRGPATPSGLAAAPAPIAGVPMSFPGGAGTRPGGI